MPDDIYLPLPFVEALGRATVARYRFELVVDTLITILAPERDRHDLHDPFEAKVDYLQAIRATQHLEHGCRQRLQAIASLSKKLNADYKDAATSAVYSRGAGNLEETLRVLAEQANISAVPLRMTPMRIDRLTRSFRALTWKASDVARNLLQMPTVGGQDQRIADEIQSEI